MAAPLRGISGIVDEGGRQQPGHGTWPGPAGHAHPGAGLSHIAFLYRDPGEYLAHVLPFVRAGQARSEPVLVAVPGDLGPRVRAALRVPDGQVSFTDMRDLGRNPARITLALGTFADQHRGQPIRAVTEPLWPGRTDAETAEVMKHESLVRLALRAVSARILCPYDASRLSPAVIDRACHSHPEILQRGHRRPSSGYRATGGTGQQADLPPPPPSAEHLSYGSQLHGVRALVGRYAERAGLPAGRCADLVLAVSELTANTLCHTTGGGTVHIWASGRDVICQVQDGGWLTDPMAGRTRPPAGSPGQGLWVVNHICDLVQMRTGPAGTITRLWFRLPGGWP
jgi:anti-sigma regulatory factor (Ser/Thr protein kinase)